MKVTDPNRRKVKLIQEAIADILAEVLQRDFHGKATLSLTIHGGTIRRIRRGVKRNI